MKIWLDDIRTPPDESWVWCKNAQQFTEMFTEHANEIREISFDHDIASYDYHGNEITGYHCFCIVEKYAFVSADFEIPQMRVHSSNPAGRAKIEAGIKSLKERFKCMTS